MTLELVTLAQAAAMLGVDDSTLRHQIRKGRLRATKLGPLWVLWTDEVERYRVESLGRHDGRRRRA